jgi:hypothetical protein
MTGRYDKAGLRFLYPENWKIADEQIADLPQSITVESPNSGFWVIMAYEPEIEPAALVEQVVESMRDEYDGLEAYPVVRKFGDTEAEGTDMMFYCLDLVVHSRVLAVRALGKSLLTMWQAEDREFEDLEPVFDAITTSLLEPDKIGPSE